MTATLDASRAAAGGVPTAPRPRRGATPFRMPAWALSTIGVVAVLALLEILPRVGVTNAKYLPPTSEIAAALFIHLQNAAFWIALGQTLTTWFTGIAISVIAALVFGSIIGSSGFLRAATSSTVEFLRPIPSVALIPVAVLMYGTTMASTLLLVVYAAFWQMFVQVVQGMRDVDPVARDTTRVYRFRIRSVAGRLVFPTVLPYAVTGFRLAASIAIILTITGELIIGTPGVGNLLAVAQTSGAVPSMYALVFVAGALGELVNLVARLVERGLLFWHPSIRKEAS